MTRVDTYKVQTQGIEALLLSGDLFTYRGLSDVAERQLGVNEGKTGLVRKTISKLEAQGKLTVGVDGRLRASTPNGGY